MLSCTPMQGMLYRKIQVEQKLKKYKKECQDFHVIKEDLKNRLDHLINKKNTGLDANGQATEDAGDVPRISFVVVILETELSRLFVFYFFYSFLFRQFFLFTLLLPPLPLPRAPPLLCISVENRVSLRLGQCLVHIHIYYI